MPFHSAQSISSRLITYYRNRTLEQKRLLNDIRKLFPLPLAEHIRHCVIADKTLVLYTDSAAWASLLRFNNPEILTAIDTAFNTKLDSIQIRILKPMAKLDGLNQQKTNIPSPENIMLLQKQSENMPDNELKLSLKKLCETLALKRDQ
ncbi:MAG: DciA family protein [Gammaproteobacteria bacterium]